MIVLSIFKDRDLTSWTPKKQVLKMVAEYPMVLNERSNCQINCLHLTADSLRSILSEAEVEMSSEDAKDRRSGKHILILNHELISEVEIMLAKDTCEISEITNKKDCSCP
ncbi:MAG: hypothetical protein RIC15_08850 [Vicingaceae bacterium]